MKHSFKSKVIIITGGASGIGKELADQLGAYGARIIIADRNASTGVETTELLRAKGQDVAFKEIDMVDTVKADELFDAVTKQYGHIDYVFNSAGTFLAGEIRDTPIGQWRDITINNTFAVMNGTHYAYQQMLKQGYGSIINLGSAAGLIPVPIMGVYGSTKFAIVGLTHTLRTEAKELGINVSVACPTIVNTPLYDTAIFNKVNKKEFFKSRHTLQTPDTTARKIIQGTIKNKATIHTAFTTKIAWTVYRIAPWLYDAICIRITRKYRQKFKL